MDIVDSNVWAARQVCLGLSWVEKSQQMLDSSPAFARKMARAGMQLVDSNLPLLLEQVEFMQAHSPADPSPV